MSQPASEHDKGVFEGVAQYLRDRSPDLIAQWRERATREPSQPARRRNLTGAKLDDHIPSLIRLLAETLRDGDTASVENEGASHGHQRRSHGYTVTEVVSELNLFREVILGALEDFNAGANSEAPAAQLAAARLRLLQLLDRSVNASVAQCMLETEEARDAAERRLEERNVALKDADAQKDRFLTMLSHELRNPLSPILAAAQVLSRMGASDPTVVKQQTIIERQARHLAKLVDDLLDVSRISHGKIELNPRVIDFQESVALAIESCRPIVEAHGLTLAVEVTNEPLRVFADLTRLAQVTANLLSNAAKFTPAGGSIHVSLDRVDNEAVLRVRDTGIGIAADMLPRVFDLFAQADTSLNRETGGLGVGLMVAKSLIEMQGGRIEVDSEGDGKGAEFAIRLPVALGSPMSWTEDPPPAPGEPDPPAGARRVVLVEDNDDAREALGEALRLFGHVVELAATGEQAIRLAETMRPDVFVIDIGLPDATGFEVARALRRLPRGRAVTLVALSGYGSPSDKARSFEAGFNFHLTKPADVDAIHSLVSRVPVVGTDE